MNNIIKRVWNQNRLVNIEDLTGMVFQAEADGHTFEISGIDDTGAVVELSGTVTGVFRRPDNADIALTGSASDGVVSVTLSEDCYAVPGRFGLTIFVTSNSQKVAVYACVGTVAVSSTGNVAGDTPANVEDLIDDINAAIADLNSAIGQIPASYANVMAAIAPTYSSSALYPVGSYTWYDGTLYRCITPITTAETWTAWHWAAIALGDDVSNLKSSLGSLDEFCRKETTIAFENDKTVPATGMSYGNFIITCDVPSGTTYSIIINDPNNALGDGGFALYADYSDSTHESLGTKQKNTEYELTAAKRIVAFSIYKGTTAGGTINTVVSYSTPTEDSLEERIEDIEAVVPIISNKVDKSNMGHCQLSNDPASSNVCDMTKLVLDKRANPVYGQIVDDTSACYYEMDVTPGDTLYFWAYSENESDPLYPYEAVIKNTKCTGIAAYNSSGAVVAASGTTNYVHSFTIDSGISKIIIDFLKSQYALGYKFIININDSVMPTRYVPYSASAQNYYAKNRFEKNVDFNRLLPISTRLPETGFIESLGHMGLSTYYPGNTAISIIGAKKAGMGGVEMDVQITQDGYYVLYHDTNMVRVGGTAQQNIGNMTLSDLEEFDYGAWFAPEFAGTDICTLEKAIMLCRQLNLKVYMDCKELTSVSDFTGALNILKKWGMEDNAYWITGSFVNCWTAVPNAKIIFAAGSPLTGDSWQEEDGWFESAINGDSIPSTKKHIEDGHYVINNDVFFGISQNHTLGKAQLQTESELARKYKMKYGLYAVDDVEDIADYAINIPYMQYMTSNSIAFQTAMNEYYNINIADYVLL